MILHESESIRVSIGESDAHLLDALSRTADIVGRVAAATGAILTLAELHPRTAESRSAQRISRVGRILGATGTAIAASQEIADAVGISRNDSPPVHEELDVHDEAIDSKD